VPTRRRLNFIIALLLPLMLLRGLLPPGYMASARNGELRITMCSEGIYVAGAKLFKEQPTSNKHQPSDSGSCPFASAVAHAPPPAVSTVFFRIDADAAVAPVAAAPVAAASLIRVQSARAPPAILL